MRKAMVFAALFLCFALTGCIDIYQHITKDAAGVDLITLKMTVSKVLFAMAAEFGDDTDYEAQFREEVLGSIDTSEFRQFNAKVDEIDDELDMGFLMSMSIDYRKKAVAAAVEEGADFIPKYTGKGMAIHLSGMGGDGYGEDSSYVMALMATAKYRLVISKKCLPKVNRVQISTSEGKMEGTFLDLHDEYMIEVPMPYLFMGDVDLVIN